MEDPKGNKLTIVETKSVALELTKESIEVIKHNIKMAESLVMTVFLKDNLKPIISHPQQEWAYGKYDNGVYTGLLRQEMPK